MPNRSTPSRSAYGPTGGGGRNKPATAGKGKATTAGNAASDTGKAIASAKKQLAPRRMRTAKP